MLTRRKEGVEEGDRELRQMIDDFEKGQKGQKGQKGTK